MGNSASTPSKIVLAYFDKAVFEYLKIFQGSPRHSCPKGVVGFTVGHSSNLMRLSSNSVPHTFAYLSMMFKASQGSKSI